MITGDNTLTGIAIARAIGMMPADAEAVVVLIDADDKHEMKCSHVGADGVPQPITFDEAKMLLQKVCPAVPPVTSWEPLVLEGCWG